MNTGLTNLTHDTTPSPSQWQQPVPFQSVNLPFFPVNELPIIIGNYVNAVAETTQTAPDMAATASLAILALCLQGKFKIEGKRDWIEPLNLYTLVVAPPAERKSVVMALIRQSFKPGEVTPEEANEIGHELAMKFTGGNHQFIVATHTDP